MKLAQGGRIGFANGSPDPFVMELLSGLNNTEVMDNVLKNNTPSLEESMFGKRRIKFITKIKSNIRPKSFFHTMLHRLQKVQHWLLNLQLDLHWLLLKLQRILLKVKAVLEQSLLKTQIQNLHRNKLSKDLVYKKFQMTWIKILQVHKELLAKY